MTKINSVLAEQMLQELGGVAIDRMAWRVVQPGEHYERPDTLRLLCFDNRPPTIDLKHNHRTAGCRITTDLHWRRVGRLTVVGYWGRQKDANPNKKGAGGGRDRQLWVCRCLCGLFTIRSARVILGAVHPDFPPMCDACKVAHLQNLGESEDVAQRFVRGARENLNLSDRERIFGKLGLRKHSKPLSDALGKLGGRHDAT